MLKQYDAYENLKVIYHSLLAVRLTTLRDKNTNREGFKHAMEQAGNIIASIVTHDLKVSPSRVETPLETFNGVAVPTKAPVIVTILRAGIGLSNGFSQILPEAPVGMIGVRRDEETHKPIEYMINLPSLAGKQVFVTDPMLATGHSLIYAIDLLKKHGATDITAVSLLAAPEGVKAVSAAHPDVMIYTASLDRQLNENAYIVPGLGDAGDRYFGTTDKPEAPSL